MGGWGDPIIRESLVGQHFQDSMKVSLVAGCRLIVSESREIIGSSDFPALSFVSCVIPGLLMPEATELREGGPD